MKPAPSPVWLPVNQSSQAQLAGIRTLPTTAGSGERQGRSRPEATRTSTVGARRVHARGRGAPSAAAAPRPGAARWQATAHPSARLPWPMGTA